MKFSRTFLNRLQNQPGANDTVVVIDVLRSFTTAAVALAHGASSIYPVEGVAAAILLAEKIELIEKKRVSFQCQFNEWTIFQYELTLHQIEFSEEYTATGVAVHALLQVHQIQPLALKLQDVTRGREQLKIIEEPEDD